VTFNHAIDLAGNVQIARDVPKLKAGKIYWPLDSTSGSRDLVASTYEFPRDRAANVSRGAKYDRFHNRLTWKSIPAIEFIGASVHADGAGPGLTPFSQILHSLANLTFVVLWPDADPDGTLATGRCNNLKLRICRNAQGWKRNTNADDRLSTLRQNQSLKEALLRRMRPAFRPIMRCVRRPDRCG
jgi:hypothetical protein